MTQLYPYICPVCGAAMTAKAKCPCEKFERLLAAAKQAVRDIDVHYERLWDDETSKFQDTAGVLALKKIVEKAEEAK